METSLKDDKIKNLCKLCKCSETMWHAKQLLEGDSGRISGESGHDIMTASPTGNLKCDTDLLINYKDWKTEGLDEN